MRHRNNPHRLLYQINTRIWLRELSMAAGRPLTLAEVPDQALDSVADQGFDLVWLLGVWRTGEVGRSIALGMAELEEEYRACLPDFTPQDVTGSPFAVTEYAAHPDLGGDEALAQIRGRLAQRGIGLILDFVPNHTARDHRWIRECPECYIQGDGQDLSVHPDRFFLAQTHAGPCVIAHGKDPYFPPWTDTAQLNYNNRSTHELLTDALLGLADRCDGVRCDMAMLMLRDIFDKTWGDRITNRPNGENPDREFWETAVDAVRERHPEFVLIAECYWNTDRRLQQMGFDYTYDKVLYDRLIYSEGAPVNEHLGAEWRFNRKALRFLENHDERRAADLFVNGKHEAAMTIAATVPGMLLVHEGQTRGARVRVPVQLIRRPDEPADEHLSDFYRRLLEVASGPVLKHGGWRPLRVSEAWEANGSYHNFVCHIWHKDDDQREAKVAVVNYSARRGQCYVAITLPWISGRKVVLRDLLNGVTYEREGDELLHPGLYLDLKPYEVHVFDVLI